MKFIKLYSIVSLSYLVACLIVLTSGMEISLAIFEYLVLIFYGLSLLGAGTFLYLLFNWKKVELSAKVKFAWASVLLVCAAAPWIFFYVLGSFLQ